MVDVVICSAPEDEAAIRPLADAIAGLGYAVWRNDAANADAVTGQIVEARAAVVVWSAAASASEGIRAEANVARGLKKLIQVSADGRPPPVPFDPAQTVSILTWRGEEDHPAWRNVRAALEGLCGPPAAAPVVAMAAMDPAPPIAPVPVPQPVPPAPVAAPTPPPKRSGGVLIALIVLLVLCALAAAAYYWMQQRERQASAPSLELNGVEPAPPSQATTAPAPAPLPVEIAAPAPEEAAFDREAVIRASSGYAAVRNTPSGLGFNVARVPAGEVFTTYAQTGEWWRVRTARGTIGYMAASDIRLRDAAAPAPAPAPGESGQASEPGSPARPAEERPRPGRSRIVKENSAVMSAFCENAGRGTPQCNAYRRDGGR